MHAGVHVEPEASELVQSPTAPLSGAPLASHGFGVHVAAVSAPAVHDEVPERV